MAGIVAFRVDQPLFLVEPQRGGGHAAALGDLADRQHVAHGPQPDAISA